MRVPRPSPTDRVAALLLAIAGGAVAVWFLTDAADAWMPNVAVTAFFVAVTVAVVERAIRREARERLQPLAERALWTILSEFRAFCECVALDYAQTHGTAGRDLPENVLDLLTLWLDDQERAVVGRPVDAAGFPALMRAATAFAGVLKATRDVYGSTFTVELAVQIDNIERNVETNRRVFADAASWAGFQSGGLAILVENARDLGTVLARHMGDDRWLRRLPGAGSTIIQGATWDAWGTPQVE